MKQYVVTTTEKEMLLELPDDWYVSAANWRKGNGYYNHNRQPDTFTLRVYSKREKQETVIQNVTSFQLIPQPEQNFSVKEKKVEQGEGWDFTEQWVESNPLEE